MNNSNSNTSYCTHHHLKNNLKCKVCGDFACSECSKHNSKLCPNCSSEEAKRNLVKLSMHLLPLFFLILFFLDHYKPHMSLKGLDSLVAAYATIMLFIKLFFLSPFEVNLRNFSLGIALTVGFIYVSQYIPPLVPIAVYGMYVFYRIALVTSTIGSLKNKKNLRNTIWNFLRYYQKCIQLEALYDKPLNLQDVTCGLMIKSSTTLPSAVISQKLYENQVFLIGYPYFKYNSHYYPLLVWAYDAQQTRLTPTEEVGFHSKVYELLDASDYPQADAVLKKLNANLASVFNLQKEYETILSEMNIVSSNIDWNPVAFIGELNSRITYSINKEFQNLLNCTTQPTAVTKVYFNENESVMSKQFTPFQIVSSNHFQNKAMENAGNTISVIQGPPGTGKTQTILNLIASEVINGGKVLVSSTNNDAVDNIVQKIESDSNSIISHFKGYSRVGSKSFIEKNIEKIEKYAESIFNNEFSSIESSLSVTKLREKSFELASSIQCYEDAEHQLTETNKNIAGIKRSIEHLEKRVIDQNACKLMYKVKTQGGYSLRNIRHLNQIILFNKLTLIPKIHKFDFPVAKLLSLFYLVKPSTMNLIDTTQPLDSALAMLDINKLLIYQDELIALIKKAEALTLTCNEALEIVPKLRSTKLEVDGNLFIKVWLNGVRKALNDPEKREALNSCILNLKTEKKIDIANSGHEVFMDLFPVTLTSNLSARRTIPQGFLYDLVIIDEASQCSIPSTISLLQSAKRICFIGDQKQLPHIPGITPTTDSNIWKQTAECADSQATKNYYHTSVSSFDRAMCCVKHSLLATHYRCAPSIINFSNKEFYNNELIINTTEPEYNIHSGGIHFLNINGNSIDKVNKEEALSVLTLIHELKSNGIQRIGVITPFRNQKEHLLKILPNDIKVGTIHTFQGAECDAIIFSSVLGFGSTQRQIEFVQKNDQMINVAVTRAIKLLIILGNETEICKTPGTLTKLVQYAKAYSSNAIQENTPDYGSSMSHYNLECFRFRKPLFNGGEKLIFEYLCSLTDKKPVTVYPKISVKDVLYLKPTNNTVLYKYYLMAHFDFVLFDNSSDRPIMAVEFDGAMHRMDKATKNRDSMKDQICSTLDFPLIRISSNNTHAGVNEVKKLLNITTQPA